MTSSLEQKRIFLIVSPSPAKLKWVEAVIHAHVSKATVYKAQDGQEALSKMLNVPPHALITDLDVPRLSGIELLTSVFRDKLLEGTSIIVTSTPPPEGHHLDELVTGRLQYCTEETDELEMAQSLARALNYSAQSQPTEFRLKFLAPGDLLLKEGDVAEFVYFVKKGELQAYHQSDEATVNLGKIDYGEFVGEMAYVNGERRSANVKAVTDCELIEVPVGQFDKVLFKRPSWSKALMMTLAKRVRAANANKLETNDPH